MNTETLDRLEALLAKADILPLEYKPDEYDDWGTIGDYALSDTFRKSGANGQSTLNFA